MSEVVRVLFMTSVPTLQTPKFPSNGVKNSPYHFGAMELVPKGSFQSAPVWLRGVGGMVQMGVVRTARTVLTRTVALCPDCLGNIASDQHWLEIIIAKELTSDVSLMILETQLKPFDHSLDEKCELAKLPSLNFCHVWSSSSDMASLWLFPLSHTQMCLAGTKKILRWSICSIRASVFLIKTVFSIECIPNVTFHLS